MGTALSTERRTQVISAVGLTAAAAAIWFLTSSRGQALVFFLQQDGAFKTTTAEIISEEKTEQIMKDLCETFFSIFTELAQVARSVAQAVQTHTFQEGEAPTKEQVEAMLMEQVFRERLYTAEAEVLKKHNITCKGTLEAACKKYQKNEKIRLYVAGLKEMFEDAVKGELPLLPGAVLPEMASEEMILEVLQRVHAVKQEKFLFVVNETQSSDFKTPTAAMAKKLQTCNKEAEQQVLSLPEYADLTETLLLHAIAFHSRNPTFKIKKQLLDEMHSEHVMAVMERRKNLLRTRGVYTPESDCVVAALHPKLEEVSASEVVSRLRKGAGDRQRAVAVLILRGNRSSSELRREAAGVAGGAREESESAVDSAGDKREEKRGKEGAERGSEELEKGRVDTRGRTEEDAAVKAMLESPSRQTGVPYLRALNDFCEAIEQIDDENLSFLYLEDHEARTVPLDVFKRAALNAHRNGAAYLLFKDSDAPKETCLLREFIKAVEDVKKVWQGELACSATSSSSFSSAAAAASKEADDLTTPAVDVPRSCPIRNESGSPSTSPPSTEAAAVDSSVADGDTTAAVSVAGRAAAAAFAPAPAARRDDAAAAEPVCTAAAAAVSYTVKAEAPAHSGEAPSADTPAEETSAGTVASDVLTIVESTASLSAGVSTVRHVGDEPPLTHMALSALGKCTS